MGKTYIVCGIPGSGKTTYGKKLAAEKKAAFIDIDTCTETLVRLSLSLTDRDPNDRDSEHFKAIYRKSIYETLYNVAITNLPHIEVVISAPFTQEIKDPDGLNKIKEILKVPVEVIYIHCDKDTRKERLKKRGSPRDTSKIRDFDHLSQNYWKEKPPVFEHTYIDNSENKKSL